MSSNTAGWGSGRHPAFTKSCSSSSAVQNNWRHLENIKSCLLCRRSDGLELDTRHSPLQTIATDKPILSLPLSTRNAVEMAHDSALYKSIIDTDTDTDINSDLTCGQQSTQYW